MYKDSQVIFCLLQQLRLPTKKNNKTINLRKLFLLLTLFFVGGQHQVFAACSPLLSLSLANYTFVNNSTKSVKLSWVDSLCIEWNKATLAPGASIVQSSWANHVWRFREATTNALLKETAVTTASPTVPVLVPTFTLNLAGPGNAATNSQYTYTTTLKNTSTTASSAGTITLRMPLPAGVVGTSITSTSGLFSCSIVGSNGTCTRNAPLAPNATDTLTANLVASTTGAKSSNVSVSGGSISGTITSNTVTTIIGPVSDLSVSLSHPSPALKANAMSQIEVRVNNIGGKPTTPPTALAFSLPPNITAPLKFSRVADNWVCTTSGQVVTCVYNQSIPVGNNTRLRIPVIPAPVTVGTVPSLFTVALGADTFEANLNNNVAFITPPAAVAPLALSTIPRFNPDGSNNLTVSAYGADDLIDPVTLPKYALPLPNLLAPFYKHTPNNAVSGVSKYTLDIKKVKTQILPPGFPATDVYAYGDPAFPNTFSYPAHTIEARSTNAAVNTSLLGKRTEVQYLNTLSDVNHVLGFNDLFGTFISIVDPTIVGANAGNPFAFHAPQTELPEPEIRSVTHLHGAIRNSANVNGHPEAWGAPNGRRGFNIATALDPLSQTPTVPFNPSPFSYSNNQEAAMLWYHDNTLGVARHNVYAGLEGLYVIRDDNEMTKIANNQLPAAQHEVPLVIQDRMFHSNGNLAYPAVNLDSLNAPVPSWTPEAYGDVMVVNGVAWPYLQVEPRLYRFRVLNASNSRFYKLSLMDNTSTATAISFKVIGSDGGFLNAPVSTTSLTMAPGERYDIVVDFTTFKGKTMTLKNAAGNLFGDALAKPEVPPTAGLVDQIMQFRVNLPKSSAPTVTLPATLRTSAPALTATVATPRKLLLWETLNEFSRIIPVLGTPDQGLKYWTDPVTEMPRTGSVETWEIYNNTFYPEPLHIDGATLQVVNRQEFTAVINENLLSNLPFIDGQLTQFAFPSAAVLPAASEQGWKDTVIVNPSPNRVAGVLDGGIVNGNVTRVRVRFDSSAGQYTWHSQRMEHMEHEMIRPLTVKNSPVVYYVDGSLNIGKLDLTTGTRTPIGNTGFSMSDVAIDSSGNIYGVSFNTLYRINPTTGATTLIGTGAYSTNALTFGSDGKLYATDVSGNLYTLSTVNGSATLIGNWGGSGSAGDLLFLNNSLYLATVTNQLLKYDLANGQLSVAVAALPATIYGLAKVDNDIYSVTTTGAIYSINLTAGIASATGVTSAGNVINGLDN